MNTLYLISNFYDYNFDRLSIILYFIVKILHFEEIDF